MKFKQILICMSFCLLLLNTQCDDDELVFAPCDTEVVINNNDYETAESDFYNFVSVIIEGDCLNIEIGASGCDGNTWETTLIDSENIAESLPPQRYLKLILNNEEDCLAVFTKEFSFNLIPLRQEDTNEVILNMEGFDTPIVYVY